MNKTPLQLKLNHYYSIAELQSLIMDKDLQVKHITNVYFNIEWRGKVYCFRKYPNNNVILTAIRHK